MKEVTTDTTDSAGPRKRSWLKIAFVVLVAILVSGAAWLWTPDKTRSELEALYLQDPGDYLVIDGVRVHLRVSGPQSKPALIMLHGFGSSLHTWEGWAEALKEDYRVVRLDLPGAGLSYPDPSGVYSDERTIELLLLLMDTLAIERATLVGNSIGGRIAWRMAAAHLDRVSALVLISPDGFASEGFQYGKAPEVSGITQLMRYVLPKSLLEMSLRPAYGDPSVLSEATVSRYYDLMLAPGSRGALIQRMAQTVLLDPRPLLSTIDVPVLLLWGELDGAIPMSNAADYQALLKNSRFVPLPGLGHVPQEEAPMRSVVPLKAFLAALP